ncbi:MAG: hypothetical protein ACI8S6_004842 [Myxococcota bacterium]|jgi:hypothetical protein
MPEPSGGLGARVIVAVAVLLVFAVVVVTIVGALGIFLVKI